MDVIVIFKFERLWLIEVGGHADTTPQTSTSRRSSITLVSAAVHVWLIVLCHLQCKATAVTTSFVTGCQFTVADEHL